MVEGLLIYAGDSLGFGSGFQRGGAGTTGGADVDGVDIDGVDIGGGWGLW